MSVRTVRFHEIELPCRNIADFKHADLAELMTLLWPFHQEPVELEHILQLLFQARGQCRTSPCLNGAANGITVLSANRSAFLTHRSNFPPFEWAGI